MTLTRVVTFHARHRYSGSDATDHGHLYRIEVSVRRDDRSDTDTVIPLDTFDRILTEEIVRPLAGRHLNEAITAFATGTPPTCEALARWCWQRIGPRLPPSTALERVRAAEDDALWADCTGTCGPGVWDGAIPS